VAASRGGIYGQCRCWRDGRQGLGRSWIARQRRSGVADIGTSVTPSGARAWSIAFITVGVLATVPPSPTPLAQRGFVVLGTGLKSILIGGIMSARGVPYSISEPVSSTVTSR
jgi:hypothetical protein